MSSELVDTIRATLLAMVLAALGIGSFAVFLASSDCIATLEAIVGAAAS